MAKCGVRDGNGATRFCLFEKITMICRSEKPVWLWPTSRSRAQSRGGRRELKPSDCSIMGLSSFRNVYWKRGSICWISRRALLSARREAAELDGSFLQKRDLLSTCPHLVRAAQISSCVSGWGFSALMGAGAESVEVRCVSTTVSHFSGKYFMVWCFCGGVWLRGRFEKPQSAKAGGCVHLTPHHHSGLGLRIFTNLLLRKTPK